MARRPKSVSSRRHARSASTSHTARREHQRRCVYRFDPKLRLMSTVDEREDGGLTVHAKGAPEELLGGRRSSAAPTNPRRSTRCARRGPRRPRTLGSPGTPRPRCRSPPAAGRGLAARAAAKMPSTTCACSVSSASSILPEPAWRRQWHAATRAGIRIVVVTGDYGKTDARDRSADRYREATAGSS